MKVQSSWGGVRRLAIAACAAALVAACGQDSPQKLVASAKGFADKGDYAAAVIQLKNALQQEPTNGEARRLLGTALLETGDPVSAEKEFRRALEYGQPPDAVLPSLARALLEQGQAKKVVAELGDKRLQAPDRHAALKATLGQAYLAVRDLEGARKAFAEALQAQPGNPRARLGEAQLLAAGQDLAGASKTVDEVLAGSPRDAEALALKGQLAMAERKYDLAADAFARTIEVAPRYVGAWFNLVLVLTEQKKLDEAKARLEGMKKIAPRDPRTQYVQALIAVREGNLAAGRDAILQVLKVAPDDVPTLVLAGTIELQSGQNAQAQEYLRKALDRVPGMPYAQRLLVTSYLRARQPARALTAIQPLLKQSPDDPLVLALAGEVYLSNNRVSEAAQFYEKAAARDAKNPAVQTRLGQISFATGDVERAVKQLEAAAELDPKSSQPDLVLVANYLRRREFDKALQVIGDIERRQPTSPLPHNLRGLAYLGKKDIATARKSFERALEVDPNYYPAALALAQLDVQDRNPDAARKRFESMLEKDPKNVPAALALADLMLAKNRPAKDVTAVLERAVKADPTSPQARLALVNHHLRTRDAKQAVIAAQEAVAALPDNNQVLEALGVAQQAAGDSQQAISTFGRLANAAPTSTAPLVRLAGAQFAAKEPDAAIATLRRALKVDPSFLDASRDIALIYVQTGRPAEAIAEAKTVQKAQPKSPAGFALEGDVLMTQKKFAEAERAYAEGLKVAPVPGLVTRQVAALDSAGKAPEGDAAAARWFKEHPKDVIVRAFLGERALRRKDYRAAMTHYKAASDAQPDNALFLNNLAWTAGQLKDPRALTYAEQAVALAPESGAVLDTYGLLLVERGEVAKGVEQLRKATQRSPLMPDIRLNLARALVKAGDKEGARKELDALLAMPNAGPFKAEAESLLKSL